jgi:hypothetical protein
VPYITVKEGPQKLYKIESVKVSDMLFLGLARKYGVLTKISTFYIQKEQNDGLKEDQPRGNLRDILLELGLWAFYYNNCKADPPNLYL